jgi:hypothetical protein
MTASLAWPVLVLIIFLLLQEQLVSLLRQLTGRVDQLKSLKGPWGEAKWSDSAEGLAREVDASLPAEPTTPESGTEATTPARSEYDPGEVALALAVIDPRAGVIASFIEVEQAAARYLEAGGVEVRGTVVGTFRRLESVPAEVRNVLVELAQLRNEAAHGRASGITQEGAANYIRAASAITRQIDALPVERGR